MGMVNFPGVGEIFVDDVHHRLVNFLRIGRLLVS